MEEESGPARWITAALPIDAVLAAYIERSAIVWLDRRKLTRHKCDSHSIAVKSIASHSLNDTTEVGASRHARKWRDQSVTHYFMVYVDGFGCLEVVAESASLDDVAKNSGGTLSVSHTPLSAM